MPAERTERRTPTTTASTYLFSRPDASLETPTASTSPSTPSTFAFAPAVTPVTYADSTTTTASPQPIASCSTSSPSIRFPEVAEASSSGSASGTSELGAEFHLYDPNTPSTPKKKRKVAKRKKGSEEEDEKEKVPRPPNAFILFRSSFIKSNRITAAVEGNASNLSKIIGRAWHHLDPEERNIWHGKAALALDEHKRTYGDRPTGQPTISAEFTLDESGAVTCIVSPNPTARKTAPKKPGKRKLREVPPKDDARCDKIAELVLQGLQGEQLETAIEEFDRTHVPPPTEHRFEVPLTAQAYRRSSSAPAIAEAGEQSRFYYPTERPTKIQKTSPRSSSTGPIQIKGEAISPVLSSAEAAPATALPPIEVSFSTDIFAPQTAPPAVTFPIPATTNIDFNCSDFHFQTGDAVVDNGISPLTCAPSVDMSFTGVDDLSMPPLVDRPFDPMTDMHLPGQFGTFAPNSAQSIAPLAVPVTLPRLSINTLSHLQEWSAQQGHGEPESPWDIATPPPLSAASNGEFSLPSTPADVSQWSWAISSPAGFSSPEFSNQWSFTESQTVIASPIHQEFAPPEQVWAAYNEGFQQTPAPTYGYTYPAAAPASMPPPPPPQPAAPQFFDPQSVAKMLAHQEPNTPLRLEFYYPPTPSMVNDQVPFGQAHVTPQYGY